MSSYTINQRFSKEYIMGWFGGQYRGIMMKQTNPNIISFQDKDGGYYMFPTFSHNIINRWNVCYGGWYYGLNVEGF